MLNMAGDAKKKTVVCSQVFDKREIKGVMFRRITKLFMQMHMASDSHAEFIYQERPVHTYGYTSI